MRFRYALLLVIGLAAPLACSGRSDVAQADQCQTIAWGGFNGTPDCQGISQQVIQGQHRACQTDNDCAVIAASACSAHAVHRQAVSIYGGFAPPCNHPLAGMCMPVQWRTVCAQGCCQPSSAAPSF